MCSSDHSAVCLSLTLPVHKAGKAGDTKDKGLQRRPKPIGWRCDKPETLNTEISARLHDAQNLDDFSNMVQNTCCETGTSTSSSTCPRVPYFDNYLNGLLRMRRSCNSREDRQELSIAIHNYRKARVKSQHEATVAKMLAQQSQYGWRKRHWPKSYAKKLPCNMMCDGVLTSNREKWCQSLTAFFADLYSNPDHEDLHDVLPDRMFQHETSLISVEDIVEVLGRMKKRRTCADDNVVAEMLQFLPMDAVVKLATLINDTLEQRVPIPSSWPTLQAILIPKRDSISVWSDLRPITICPTLCKVWDAVLLRKIQNYVLPNLSTWQFAFMPGRSIRSPTTITSLLGEKTRERGQKMFAMLLDIWKAFDKLLHTAIINALHSHDVPHEYIHAIASGYKNPKSTFKLDSNVISELVDIQSGYDKAHP